MSENSLTAFVMSSGGVRGALQAGALLALMEAGIVPDMLVGTSSGALNAAFLASDPTLEGANKLANIWRHARKQDFFPGNVADIAKRLIEGQSLYPNDGLRRFAETHIPPDKRTFGDLSIKLFITSTNLNTGKLLLWGDDPSASVVEAALASASYPLAYPPFRFGNFQLVDGAVVANVPIGVAVDYGARNIYILNVGYAGDPVMDQTNLISILNRSIGLSFYTQFMIDLKYAERVPGIQLHHIAIKGFDNVGLFDVEQGPAMVEAGYQQTKAFLKWESNDTLGRPRIPPIDIPSGGGEGDEEPNVPNGAREYIPPWLR